MHERTLFIAQACLIALVGGVHIAAIKWNLYWYFLWLDLFVHFFAALWVALFATWLLIRTKQTVSFWKVFGIVVIAGIGWELFEVWRGVPREANFALDTALDLLMDVLGGVVGFFVASRLREHDTIIPHGANESHSS